MKTFSTPQVLEIAQLKDKTLQQWMYNGFLHLPDDFVHPGNGKSREWTPNMLKKVLLFKLLLHNGFSRTKAADIIKVTNFNAQRTLVFLTGISITVYLTEINKLVNKEAA